VQGPQLEHYDHFPDALLAVPAAQLWRQLPGPALFQIPGRRAEPLFVSVLLHGNEDTGWRAIQAVLQRHRGALLPRALLLFVGNVAAARANVRTLPEQQDYNRSWPGTLQPHTPVAQLLRDLVAILREQRPFASIDIHNNSGHNPHYCCVNSFAEPQLHLARLFGRTVVYFERPLGVQSAALTKLCPAVTVECGRAGEPAGVAHAAELIEAALAIQHFPDHPVAHGDLDLMQTFAIVKLPSDASFSADGTDRDFMFRADLDRLNFSELDAGTVFGTLGNGGRRRLEILPADDFGTTETYFEYTGGVIRLSQRVIPSMLTLDEHAIRLDCLGYLMHRIGRDGRRIID
jgi:hypothetical protein